MGPNFKWKDVQSLQMGMSKAEVVQILGKPTSVTATTTDQGQREVYVWVHVDAFMNSKYVSVVFLNDMVTSLPPVPEGAKD
ncbi:MAG: outer membrane protein assembly factor BamE domain-containing protein [Candidatus Micrarchaeota archaeon]